MSDNCIDPGYNVSVTGLTFPADFKQNLEKLGADSEEYQFYQALLGGSIPDKKCTLDLKDKTVTIEPDTPN